MHLMRGHLVLKLNFCRQSGTGRKKVATLVTTRCSGCSYMNRVELQNGCLSRGHSNTFIPSTIAGTSLDPSSGKLSEEKVKENLSLAIDVYIS